MPNPTCCCCLDFRTSWAVWAQRCLGSAVHLDENKSSWNICGFMDIWSVFCSADCLLPLDGAFFIDESNHRWAFTFFSPSKPGCASRLKALECLGCFFLSTLPVEVPFGILVLFRGLEQSWWCGGTRIHQILVQAPWLSVVATGLGGVATSHHLGGGWL